jgi:cytochrome c
MSDHRRTLVKLALVGPVALLVIAPSSHAQDAVAGKAAFAQCAACHTTDDTSAVAPTLKGVVGRKVGSVTGFRYSRAMKATDYAWDAAKLDAYIADPQKAIRGNVMPFSGIPDPKQRADVVAYLQTLK